MITFSAKCHVSWSAIVSNHRVSSIIKGSLAQKLPIYERHLSKVKSSRVVSRRVESSRVVSSRVVSSRVESSI